MPIGSSSYCKRCEKIQVDGVHGNWLKQKPGKAVVCMCAQPAILKLVDGNDKETTWSPLSIQPRGFSPGISTFVGSSWTRPGDKFSANPVTVKRVGEKTRSEEQRNNGREIERKYRVMDGVSLNTLHHYLMSLLGPDSLGPYSIVEGASIDIFWSQPGVDFIRLRENTRELTVKVTDKLTTEDRVERNLKVDSFEKGLQWATTVFGKPKGANRTTFYVYYLPTAEVTIYEVKDYDQVFLEIEAGSIEEVARIEAELRKTITLKQELQSLYQILFGGK